MRRDGWKKTFASASKRNNFKDNMFQRLLTWLTLPQIRQQQKSNQFTYGVGKPHSLKLSCIRKSFHFASILLQRHEERRENSDLFIHSKFRHFIFGLEKLLASGGGGREMKKGAHIGTIRGRPVLAWGTGTMSVLDQNPPKRWHHPHQEYHLCLPEILNQSNGYTRGVRAYSLCLVMPK